MAEPYPIALVCSVPFECERLRAALAGAEEARFGGKRGWMGRIDGVPVVLLPGGMGKANAAHALTAVLERGPLAGAVCFGIGGAYPGGGLALGEVALADQCVYGDEGVQTPDGWISTEGIGIPLWKGFHNVFPVDDRWLAGARAALEGAGIPVRVGPFVTVSCGSGTDALAAAVASRVPGALCEGMEGAALAQVAAIYGIPFLELRAVSNVVEDRDPARWRIADAAEAAQHAVRAILPALGGWSAPCSPPPPTQTGARPTMADWDPVEREARAERVLEAYRDRRRNRRGDDTWYGAAEGLLDGIEVDPDAASRRRVDLVQEALDVGMPDELAELFYDVAQEEGVDPALAFELVRSGLGIVPPEEGLANAPAAPTTDKYRPEWLEPPVPPDTLLRERALRVSFRRLRALLEAHAGDAAEAFRAFAREPDAGPLGY